MHFSDIGLGPFELHLGRGLWASRAWSRRASAKSKWTHSLGPLTRHPMSSVKPGISLAWGYRQCYDQVPESRGKSVKPLTQREAVTVHSPICMCANSHWMQSWPCLPHCRAPTARDEARLLKYTQPLSPMSPAILHFSPPLVLSADWVLRGPWLQVQSYSEEEESHWPSRPGHHHLYQTFAGEDSRSEWISRLSLSLSLCLSLSLSVSLGSQTGPHIASTCWDFYKYSQWSVPHPAC